MSVTMPAIHSASGLIETIRVPLEEAARDAVTALMEGGTAEGEATVRVAALLIGALGGVVAALAADAGRAPDARTFEAMFDLDGMVDHFQAPLSQGIGAAAKAMVRDGYSSEAATVLAASRALDTLANIVKARR